MEQFLRHAAIFLVISGFTCSIRPEPAHHSLPTVDNSNTLKAAVEASTYKFFLPHLAVVLPHLAETRAHTTKELDSPAQFTAGDEKDKTEYIPVSLQIGKQELDQFVSTLSTGCARQFNNTLLGKGSAGDLHMFGTQDVGSNATSCAKLGGVFCFTEATLMRTKKMKMRQRKIESETAASGNSCLPSECVGADDLKSLASFMRTQALTSMPGHELELHVDCSKQWWHGGGSAEVGTPQSSSIFTAPSVTVAGVMLVLLQFAVASL